ncbi:MAG: hypothetical protein GEU88_19590 [Solirubrobacterales bacterium]|nr:hypothetical protein [Solirubrobacterales bacterium]
MTGIVHHPWGPRLYLAGLRVHHGSAGCALALAGLKRHAPLLTVAGLVMVLDDLADFPWRDCDSH